MKIDPVIFREYDIRGVAGRDLDESVYARLGMAFAAYLRGKRKHNCVAVCRDGRLTSKSFSNALIDGLTACGLDVLDIGEGPSPLLYYALYTQQVDGGIMITASHNPKEYNGMKCAVGTDALHGAQIRRLGELAAKGDFPKGKASVTITRKDLVPRYMKRILRDVKLKRKLKVVVDAGNGVSGPIAVPLFEAMGCEVIPLYCDVDGAFPNHPADPTVPANMRKCIATVKRYKADVGLGFDGDGDRVGVVDEKGNLLFGDRLLILFARAVLKAKPGATIIGEVKCSRTLYEDIAKHGGKAIMSRTGHSLIKANMKKHKAELAGEMSGHMFFKHRWYGFDDGVYAAARLLEILASGRQTLSQRLSDIPQTIVTPEIQIPTQESRKFEVVAKATQYFQKELGLKVITIDGARIEFEDGWGLVRASNTSPKLVMRFEAATQKRLNAIRHLVESKVNELNK